MLERTSIVMLKMGAVDLASLGDRWRKSSQETHQQSSTTTNIALIELPFRRLVQQVFEALAGDDRDIDLYHWSSERFSAAWKATISVLVAKGRARVGVAAAAADWPKGIRDLQFLDREGYATAT